MKVWERTIREIAEDAGIVLRPTLGWRPCALLVREKWAALLDMSIEDRQLFKAFQEQCIIDRTPRYLFTHNTCAFCLKAEIISGEQDYGRNAATCAACVLAGKCYDPNWKLRKILQAIKDGRWVDARNHVQAGLDWIDGQLGINK